MSATARANTQSSMVRSANSFMPNRRLALPGERLIATLGPDVAGDVAAPGAGGWLPGSGRVPPFSGAVRSTGPGVRTGPAEGALGIPGIAGAVGAVATAASTAAYALGVDGG